MARLLSKTGKLFLLLLAWTGLLLLFHSLFPERISQLRSEINHWTPAELIKAMEGEKVLETNTKMDTLVKTVDREEKTMESEHKEETRLNQIYSNFANLPNTGLEKNGKEFTVVSSTNWEELTRNDPVLGDWTTCANSKFSRVVISKKKESYNIGDIVIVNITVKDFLGGGKDKGGDVVRVLVKDKANNASSTGYVLDMHDGSYIGVVKLLWAGNITIEAFVGAPRELIRFMYHNVRIGKQRRPIAANFTRGKNAFNVACTPMEEVARQYKEFCNLTHRNADLLWFCEKAPGYTCSDNWVIVYEKQQLVLTHQEERMLTGVAISLKMSPSINLGVKQVTPGKDHFIQENKLVPCHKLPVKDTWNNTSPTGYLYHGVWYSTQCMVTFDGSKASYEKCFRGRKVWLLGDSNMREMASHFIEKMNLTLVTEKWTKLRWHKASLASNKDGTIFLFWGMHALPRYSSEPSVNGSHQYIDSIPANSSDTVVVHFYMHFQPFHPSVVRNHIRKTAESIKSLKARAPETKVVVRGSHVLFMPKDISHFNDFWGYVYNKILKEEFASLMQEVIFLDVWDITAAQENTSMHPSTDILVQVINYMMSLLCPTKGFLV